MTTETTKHRPHVRAVWAEAEALDGTWIIGVRETNGLPWPRNDADQAHFSEVTAGRVLVMGVNTYRSMPGGVQRPSDAADRPVIVVTTPERFGEAMELTHGGYAQPVPTGGTYPDGLRDPFALGDRDGLLEAIAEWFPGKDVAVIGGAKVIEAMLPVTDELQVTTIKGRYVGDVLAPSPAVFDQFTQAGAVWLDEDTPMHVYTRKAAQ